VGKASLLKLTSKGILQTKRCELKTLVSEVLIKEHYAGSERDISIKLDIEPKMNIEPNP